MKVHIPTPLRNYTERQGTVAVEGVTVAEGLEQLVQRFPEMRQHLFTSDGKLRSFVNVYVNDEDVRYLPEKEHTGVDDAAELSIIPSIAGGCCPLAACCCR
jgi:sulfur-carrier protein